MQLSVPLWGAAPLYETDAAPDRRQTGIVPYALGGANDFTIPVCEASNNRLGGQVDKPVIEYYPVRSERFFLGLEGTDGTRPTLDLSGTGYIDGEEVDIRYVVGPKGKDMRITSREIIRTRTENGEHWETKGSPIAIRQALEGKIMSQAAQGKWVKTEKGEIITLENLDRILQEATREHVNPSVLMKLEFERIWTWRFFAKLALAAGHYFFGEDFSRSDRAAALRKAMNASRFEDITLPGAVIYPDIESLPRQFQLFKLKAFHTIVVTHGQPRILMVSLFGWLDACIGLDEIKDGCTTMRPGNLEVVGIELPTRKWARYSIEDYVKVRLERERNTSSRPERP
jgi:hypothetical protein